MPKSQRPDKRGILGGRPLHPDTHILRTQLRKARAANAVLAFLLFTILTALVLTYAAH